MNSNITQKSAGTNRRTAGLVIRMTGLIVAMAVAMAVVVGGQSHANERDTEATATVQTSTIEAGAAAPEVKDDNAPAESLSIRPVSYTTYGCVGMLSSTQMQVMAFAFGFCPTVVVLQNTSWGRWAVNHVVNYLCRQAWVVRAATWGRYSSC